tara:strand:+ start:2502 stop:2978 length:477 start_codon:yes stop_codon:yes gene_type:complete
MDNIDILKQFGTLSNFRDFLNEQINDGHEISRGKDPNDMSKEQKKERDKRKKSIRVSEEDKKISKEVTKKADGSAKEVHYDTSEPEAAPDDGQAADQVPPSPVVVDPSQAPGSQIAIGRKEVDNVEADPKAVEIDISGDTNAVNVKPTIQKKGNGTQR